LLIGFCLKIYNKIIFFLKSDYRKNSTKDDIHPILLGDAEHLSNMPPFTQRIFKGLLLDDLFMGRIEIPTSSFNTEINQQHQQILLLQVERQQFFNSLLYNNEIIFLLETGLNNYLCSGIWFQQFQEVIISHPQSLLATKRLVAYFLILDRVEASKFSYIIGWVLFKLLDLNLFSLCTI